MTRTSKKSRDAASVRVVKADGEVEPFRERKLRASLRRAGASRADIAAVLDVVAANIHDRITTRKLYDLAYRTLRRRQRPTAARYSLHKAMQQLGPSGYPFERFVAALWTAEGWRTKVSLSMRGSYVSHEVDVRGSRGKRTDLAECKFRRQRDGKVDVKVALYVYARSLDLRGAHDFDRFWLVTNGRFTSDALRYGEGVGLGMLGWDSPRGDGLKDRIDRAGLHPVTALTGLRARDKRDLLAREVVLCRQLRDRPALLDGLRIPERQRRQILAEAAALADGGAGR